MYYLAIYLFFSSIYFLFIFHFNAYSLVINFMIMGGRLDKVIRPSLTALVPSRLLCNFIIYVIPFVFLYLVNNVFLFLYNVSWFKNNYDDDDDDIKSCNSNKTYTV